MAASGINDIQPLGAVMQEERVSRELHRQDSSSDDEKKSQGELGLSAVPYDNNTKASIDDDDFVPYDIQKGEPFPESDLPDENGSGFTWRAVIIGQSLGLIIAASNVYLGLKTGFTFGAGLFGALAGCAIIKAMSRSGLPERFGGGFFGPRENVTVQSAATAAGSLTGMFVAAIPAAAQLGLLNDPIKDFGRLFTFCLCSAYYGVFFAIPLRKFYILRQRLVFPSATATALTIRAIHAPGGDAVMKKKTTCLLVSFVLSFVFVIVRQYAPGILQDWDIAYWVYASQGSPKGIAAMEWGWGYIELTPAFFGAGILSGMNASWSFFAGAVIAWGIIGPATVKTGLTKGAPSPDEPAFTYYTSMNPAKRITPRYWLLWVGVAIMLFYSVAELLVAAPAIYKSMKGMFVDMYRTARKLPPSEKDEDVQVDPVPKEQQVQSWSWPLGWIISGVVTILVTTLQFHMNGGNTVLSILLAFIFAFIAVSVSGRTDINPVGTVAKMSQLIVGGALKSEGRTGAPAQLENLLAGSIASSAAGHAVDMLSDLKTGHLVRASPRAQYYAQLWGSIVAVPFSVGMYVLFAKAYPCVVDGAVFDEGNCEFAAPAVLSWRFISIAVTKSGAIPFSSGMTALGLGLGSAALVFIKHFFIPQKYHVWIINPAAAGLAFTLPPPHIYEAAMVMGATFALIWAKRNPRHFDVYGYVLAAGLVCGEGLAGVFNAVLEIAGVSGSKYGTSIGTRPF